MATNFGWLVGWLSWKNKNIIKKTVGVLATYIEGHVSTCIKNQQKRSTSSQAYKTILKHEINPGNLGKQARKLANT